MYVYKSTEVRKYHEVDTNEAVQHTTTTLYNYTYTATTPNRSPTVRVQLYTYFRKYSILSYLRRYTHVREGTRTVRVQCTLSFPLNKRGVQRAVNCTAVHVQRCTTALRVYVNRIRVQLHTVVLSKVLKVSYEDMYCTVPSKVLQSTFVRTKVRTRSSTLYSTPNDILSAVFQHLSFVRLFFQTGSTLQRPSIRAYLRRRGRSAVSIRKSGLHVLVK